MSQSIEVGERVPNFCRLDQQRQPITFYQYYCGRPVVLVVVRDWRGEAEAVAALSSAARQWELAVLLSGDPELARGAAETLPDGVRVLADDGAVSGFLAGDDVQLRVLALDANLRLLAHGGPELDAAALVALYGREAEMAPRVLAGQAPALIVPRAFEADFCGRLIQAYHQSNEPSGVLELIDGRMVYREDPQTKIRREHRLTPGPLLEAVAGRIQRRVLPEIQWCFNFQVTGYEGVKVVSYDAGAGGYFGAHRDNDGEDTAHRRFAMTVNLNQEDYEGGELRFPEYGDFRYAPASGAAIVFSCNLAHEALPVRSGRRFALVSFFYGQGDKLSRAEYTNQVADRSAASPGGPRWG